MAIQDYAVAPAPPPPVSVFDRLDKAVASLNEARSSAMILADRLVGPVPTSQTSSGRSGGEMGSVFATVGLSADRLNDIASDIFEAIRRIENSLP